MATAKNTRNPDAGKVLDVTPPHKVAPSTTSKPVIVSNHPIIRDPMMVNNGTTAAPSEINDTTTSESLAPSKTKLVIQPLHDIADKQDKSDEPTADGLIPNLPDFDDSTVEEKPLAVSSTTGEDPAAKEPVKEEPKKPVIKATPKSSIVEGDDQAAVAPVAALQKESAEPVAPKTSIPKAFEADNPDIAPPGDDSSEEGAPKVDQEAIDKEAAEKAEAIERLIDSKQYYLPITSVTKRRIRHELTLLLLLVAVLLLAAAVLVGYLVYKDGSFDAAKDQIVKYL